MPPVDLPLLLTFAGFLGLAVGSFLNVVAHRLPIMLERDMTDAALAQLALQTPDGTAPAMANQAGTERFGLLWPPSRCPSCGHRLRWHENIPLLSFLRQRGRCSACAAPISWRYPLVEALTAIAFVVTAWRFGADWPTLVVWGFTSSLIAMALIDHDHQILPDPLTYLLLWSGLLISLTGAFATPRDAIIGAATAYGALYLLWWIWLVVFGREGMGLGDAKLLAALGAWFGWQALPAILLVAALLGIVWHLVARRRTSTDSDGRVAFGPALAGVGWIYAISGQDLAALFQAAADRLTV